VACRPKTTNTPIAHPAEINYTSLGDSISMVAQQALMGQLMRAMEEGGSTHAVNFCSERAIPITDSLSKKYNCEIKRVALGNRNPDNRLTAADQKIYDSYIQSLEDSIVLESKVVEQQNEMLFYKPIVLGMPACLQCHGKNDEINPATRAAIQSKYPEDKATGFSMGELRGMWKISFPATTDN